MSSNTADDCSICLSDLAPGSALLTLACNHKFHLQCLALNIQASNNTCPLCRVAIDPSVEKLLAGARQPPMTNVTPSFNYQQPIRVPQRHVSYFCMKNALEGQKANLFLVVL